MPTPDTLIPFGKYKGQPLATLQADRDYAEWLTQQAWFVEKYHHIHTLIINNFGEPDETPEHNQLQLRFFETDFLSRCAAATLQSLAPQDQAWYTELSHAWYAPPTGLQFEWNGIDVVWRVPRWYVKTERTKDVTPTPLHVMYEEARHALLRPYVGAAPAWLTLHSLELGYGAEDGTSDVSRCYRETKKRNDALTKSFPYGLNACTAEEFERAKEETSQALTAWKNACLPALLAFEEAWEDRRPFFENTVESLVLFPRLGMYADERFAVECKPTLGDDYPAVLRLLRSLRGKKDAEGPLDGKHVALVIEDFHAKGGTLAQVKAFFYQARIALLTTEEIEAHPPLRHCSTWEKMCWKDLEAGQDS